MGLRNASNSDFRNGNQARVVPLPNADPHSRHILLGVFTRPNTEAATVAVA